jgi:hypothetical protein
LPAKDEIVFKALQTYSDGEIVRWIDTPTAGGGEPEHPAPTLKLAKASTTGSTGMDVSASAAPAGDTASASKADNSRANGALGFGIGALVMALVGLLLIGQGGDAPPTTT